MKCRKYRGLLLLAFSLCLTGCSAGGAKESSQATVDTAIESAATDTKESGESAAEENVGEESANLHRWCGSYSFEESTKEGDGSLAFMEYTIDIYEESEEYFAEIAMDGQNTLARIRAKVQGNEQRIDLIFEEYTYEHVIGGISDETNSILCSLEIVENELLTYWGGITPMLTENEQSGKAYFEKAGLLNLSDDLYSFQMSINGTVYQFPMEAAQFKEMGWLYHGGATERINSNYWDEGDWRYEDGVTVHAALANYTVDLQSPRDCTIGGIHIGDFGRDRDDLMRRGYEIIMPGGITYGVSTKEEVLATYGEPASDTDRLVCYRLAEGFFAREVSFWFDDKEVLDAIVVRNLYEPEVIGERYHPEEGPLLEEQVADPTVPKAVTDYVAPTAVGDSLYDFDVQLEGHYYRLPCPVSELLANGFEMKDAPEVVGAKTGCYVEFTYNGKSFTGSINNFADYGTVPENCFVIELMTAADESANFDLVIPCGIQLGDSEATVRKKIGDHFFEDNPREPGDEASVDDYTVFYVYAPDKWRTHGYTIYLEDDKVTYIEVENFVYEL